MTKKDKDSPSRGQRPYRLKRSCRNVLRCVGRVWVYWKVFRYGYALYKEFSRGGITAYATPLSHNRVGIISFASEELSCCALQSGLRLLYNLTFSRGWCKSAKDCLKHYTLRGTLLWILRKTFRALVSYHCLYFFLAPTVCWWARINVESIITHSVSTSTANVLKIICQTPN